MKPIRSVALGLMLWASPVGSGSPLLSKWRAPRTISVTGAPIAPGWSESASLLSAALPGGYLGFTPPALGLSLACLVSRFASRSSEKEMPMPRDMTGRRRLSPDCRPRLAWTMRGLALALFTESSGWTPSAGWPERASPCSSGALRKRAVP